MNKELLKLKKYLVKVNTPTRERQVCKALQTIFHDMQVGLTEKEAFDILGWNYSSKEELFSIHDKNDIVVTPYSEFESIVFNTNHKKELDGIKGAIVFPDKTTHDENYLEFISKDKLRDKYNFKDGDEVTLTIDINNLI